MAMCVLNVPWGGGGSWFDAAEFLPTLHELRDCSCDGESPYGKFLHMSVVMREAFVKVSHLPPGPYRALG